MPPEEFEPLAQKWGLSNDQEVIIYDDNASLHSARVWWVLRYHGHRNVRVSTAASTRGSTRGGR